MKSIINELFYGNVSGSDLSLPQNDLEEEKQCFETLTDKEDV